MDIIGDRGFLLSDVATARSPLARLRGLIGQDPFPLLLATRSVHGFGLRRAVWAVGIAADGSVLAVRQLRRRRLLWIAGARWILELPIDATPPAHEERLVFEPPWRQSGSDARPSLSVRHPDRQPR